MSERKNNRGIERRSTREKRKYRSSFTRKSRLIGAGCLFLFILLFVQMASAKSDTTAQIILGVENAEIFQGEPLPNPVVYVQCPEEQQGIILDEGNGYSVKELVEMFQKGEGYTIECEADGTVDGKFEEKIKLTDDMSVNLQNNYADKLYLTTYDGVLNVKNKVGTPDGNKFKRYDGTYVTSEFVDYKGDTYYYNKDGEMLTGWRTIKSNQYHFKKSGVMERNTWKKLKSGGKGYLGADGIVTTGWLDLENELYYFEDDGTMVTGKKTIGYSKCKFGKDGKLVSKKSTLDPDKPMMALTFDDGPGERTMEILNVLEKYNAHATFFMQGKNVSSYGDEIRKMYEIGCELGNHSYDHPQLTTLSDGGAEQIGTTNSLLKEQCGHPATVMRPPYGDINDTVRANVGMPMILWNVDTLDWKTMDVTSTINNVLINADDGDVVLMHDIHSPTVDATLQLIPQLIANGYQLVTVSELAEARGVVLEAGVSYTDFNLSGQENEF